LLVGYAPEDQIATLADGRLNHRRNFTLQRSNTSDIMNMLAGAATPAVSAKVAGALGLPEAAVRKAMTAGLPVIVATLLK
jgi:hypothetical protein